LLLLKKYSLKQKNNSAQHKSFDSSDMIYLLMPDRFANGNTKTIMMPPQPKNTIVIYRAEDMAVT
jgi:hypothetical protein